jgi:hypothetical protein
MPETSIGCEQGLSFRDGVVAASAFRSAFIMKMPGAFRTKTLDRQKSDFGGELANAQG